ncbi:MAG: ATP-binding protein [Prevotella sp.]|nr:ATP-binding protein [Prevotella sp.]
MKKLKAIFALALLLTAGCTQTVHAYSDHRHHKTDSLEAVLNGNRSLSDEERIEIYKGLMWGYQPIDGRQAEHYARLALALSYDHPWLNTRADALRVLGLMAYGSERYAEAEHYFMEALDVTDSMRNRREYDDATIDDNYSAIYGSLGNLYNIQDKTLLAIEYYQKAEPVFQKYGWQESLTILHHNIAELYNSMGNDEEAERHYLLAVESGEASGDSLLMSLPRKGLVKVYISQGNYQRAEETIMPAYRYYRAHIDEEPSDYAEVLASMIKLNLMSGHEDLPTAKAFAKEALTYADKGLMAEIVHDVYSAATMIAMREGRWQEALDYGLKSIHENDDEATFCDIGCYEMLANIYMQLGRKEEASLYISKVRTMTERFATDHYQSGLSQMEVLYETEKKEAEIATLAGERRLHLWLLALTVALLVAMVIGYCLLIVVHRRQKALLAARVALETEAKERSILARDLHDSLGGMLSLLRMKIEGGATADETLHLLNTTHTELRRVSHHLMPEELLRGGLVPALSDFAISVPGARFQAVGDISLSKEQELVLYRCAYELVNNALKHAQAAHIDIQLMQQPQEVTLTVSDDGQGMAEAKSGMGLQNVRDRIEPYRGTLNIISSKGQGTEINVTLPL